VLTLELVRCWSFEVLTKPCSDNHWPEYANDDTGDNLSESQTIVRIVRTNGRTDCEETVYNAKNDFTHPLPPGKFRFMGCSLTSA